MHQSTNNSIRFRRTSGERCKLPQRGLGLSPSRDRIWWILALKSDIWWQQFQWFYWESTRQISCSLNNKELWQFILRKEKQTKRTNVIAWGGSYEPTEPPLVTGLAPLEYALCPREYESSQCTERRQRPQVSHFFVHTITLQHSGLSTNSTVFTSAIGLCQVYIINTDRNKSYSRLWPTLTTVTEYSKNG